MRNFYTGILSFVLLLCASLAQAQVSLYTFNATSGTYTPITGGTQIAKATGATGNASLDDVNYTAVAIPFSFTFNGTAYNTLTVNSNGFITFGATTPPAGTPYTPIADNTAYAGAVSALANDNRGIFVTTADRTSGSTVLTNATSTVGVFAGDVITGTGIPTGTTVVSVTSNTITLSAATTSTGTAGTITLYSGEIRAEAIGTAPNRTFVIQWRGFQRYGSSNSSLSFQIRLKEGGGVAANQSIDVVYGTFLPTSTSFQVGLRGATSADFNDRTNTTSWATTTAGTTNAATMTLSSTVFPAPGQTYTWTPPLPCSGPPVAGTTVATPAAVCFGGQVTLSLTGGSTGTGLAYQWQSSPLTPTNWTDIPGANTATYTFSARASLQYRAKLTCTNSNLFDYSSNLAVSVSNPPTYATIPYTQGFENWLSVCGTSDRPDNSWVGTPFSSDSAWRRDDQGTTAAWSSVLGAYTPVFTEGAHSARFHSYNAPLGKRGYLDLYVDLSTITTDKLLKFDYINVDGTDSLTILLSTDGGNTFTRLDSLKNRTSWSNKQILISSNSPTAVIRFRATSDFGNTDIGIDRLQIVSGCTSTPTPGTIAITSGGTPLCIGRSVTLSVTGQSQSAGIAYLWQSSPNNTLWTNISGATTTSYTASPTTNTYYRLRVICTNTNDTATTNTVLVSVTNPTILTTTPATRCGPGTVTLSATSSTGSTINWYASATGGSPVGTGPTFTTPFLPAGTTYYVAANVGGGSVDVGPMTTTTNCGTQAGSTATDWPLRFNTTAPLTLNSAYVVPQAAGTLTVALRNALSGTNIQSIDFTFTTAQVGVPQQINLGWSIATPGSYQITNVSGGVQRIGNFTCNYPFTTPSGAFSIVGSATTSTSATNTDTYNSFYQLNVSEGCESGRTAVAAGVVPGPLFDITDNTTVCNNAVVALGVNTNLSAFDTYVWSPATGLYTDPGATTPYVAGSSRSLVFAKNATAGLYTYSVIAKNNTTNCQNVDTVRVTVLPASVTLSASPAQICVSGSTTLSYAPSSGFGTATNQWYTSPNGTSYTAIGSATGQTYTTPVINTSTYYKLEIKDAAGNTCLQPTYQVVVNNPLVLSTTPAARCGDGTVNLTATANTGSTLNWYAAATGGTPLGSGPTFTTPTLTPGTTTFYVAAASGTGATNVGLSPTATNCGTIAGSAATDWPLRFNTTGPVTINSAYVIPQAAGTLTVALRTALSGTDIQTANFTFTSSQVGTPQQITLGWNIPTPGNYQITNSSGTIYRIGTYTCSYPFTSGAFSIVGSATSSTSATNTTTYNAFFQLSISEACESNRVAVPVVVNPITAFVTQPRNQSICAGSPVTFSVTAQGTALTYQWRKGTTPITGATSASYTINNVTAADAGTYNVVIAGVCGTATSVDVTLVVAATNGGWIGVLSNDWSNAGNWCGGIPTATTDVVITAGTPFAPVISGIGEVRSITINNGTSLTIAAGGLLNVNGNFTNNGTFTAPSGFVAFKGTTNQTVGTINAGSVLMNGTGGVTLAGTMTVANALVFTSGNITLGANNLVLNGSASGSATSHVITNGSGSVISNNITAGPVTIPVGPDANNYNPVIISNGQGRNYSARVITGISPVINNPNRAINRTWIVTPNTPVSSAVNVVLQYTDADLNSSATSTLLMEAAVHNGTSWTVVSPTIGVTPSGTPSDRQVGINTTQFGPIAVGNFGSVSFPTATANVDPDVAGMLMMPNLVQSQSVLRVQSRRTMRINWCVVDGNGRIVMTFGKQVMAGQNDIPLQLDHLAKGAYQIIGSTEKGKTTVLRFVKL